jgi:hypothetical protein
MSLMRFSIWRRRAAKGDASPSLIRNALKVAQLQVRNMFKGTDSPGNRWRFQLRLSTWQSDVVER